MKDLYNNLAFTKVLDPVSLADGDSMETVVDLADFNSAVVIWHCGISGAAGESNYWTCTLQHADDDGTGSAGDYANVAAADVLGVTPASGVVFTMDDESDEDSQIYSCGYVGGKRFLKVKLDEQGAGPTMLQSAMVIKSHGLDVPAI